MNYTFETVTCNLCESDKSSFITDKGKYGLPLNVVLCEECGLGYLNPRWDAASYGSFYENDYDKYYRPNILSKKKKVSSSINPVTQRFKLYNQKNSNPKSILDIGSGAGKNLGELSNQYKCSSLFAIEPSRASQKILEQNNVVVISNDVDSNWEVNYENRFDIIIMRHVLEHFLDPSAILNKVNKVLSDEGILYLAVPNCLNPVQNLEKSWFRNVHTFYFNKYTLENFFNKSNLKILTMMEGDEYNNGEIYLFAEKALCSIPLNIKKEHYTEQLKVYNERFEYDKSPINAMIRRLKSFKKAIT